MFPGKLQGLFSSITVLAYSLTDEQFLDVWVGTDGRAAALSSNGTILHFGGGTIRRRRPDGGQRLWSVWGGSSRDIFAVGDYGTILHFDGFRWRVVEDGGYSDPIYTSVWGHPDGSVFVGGYPSIILNGSPQ
jgi:hypothetical protein